MGKASETVTVATPVRVRGWWRASAVTASAVLVGALAMAAPAAPVHAAQNDTSADPLITVVHESSETNADLWKGVDLRCGGSFVGGGGYVTGPASQNVGLSQVAPGSTGGAALDFRWAMRVSATAAPETTPADWTLHAYGICVNRLSGVEYQTASASGTPQPDPTASWSVQAIAVCADEDVERVLDTSGFHDRSVAHTTAQCPSGQHPTGAGFLHAGEPGNLAQSLLIPWSGRVMGTTRTDTRTAAGDWLTGAYALCIRADFS